jgi:ketopantoate reductase
MPFISGVKSAGRAALSGGVRLTLEKVTGTGAGAMQVRRFGLAQEPPGQGTEQVTSERRVTQELGRARSLSMNGGIEPIQFGSTPKEAMTVFGGTGSQGVTFATGLSANFGKTHDQWAVIPVRGDLRRAQEETRVTKPGGKPQRLADMPGIMFVKDPADSGVEPAKMNVVFTTPSIALQALLKGVPQGVKALMATYNGTPPILDSVEPPHGISMFISRFDGKSFTYDVGGRLIVGEDAPMLADLQVIFQGGAIIAIVATPDVHTAQWTKIGVNTVLNSLATIFGANLGEIKARAALDPRFNRLMQGLIQEVHDVAIKVGTRTTPDGIRMSILGAADKFPKHVSSMGDAFRDGKPTEEDVLSGGVAMQGRRYGVQTPLCALATTAIKTMQQLRGPGAMPSDFEQQHAVKLAALREGLLQAAAQSAE